MTREHSDAALQRNVGEREVPTSVNIIRLAGHFNLLTANRVEPVYAPNQEHPLGPLPSNSGSQARVYADSRDSSRVIKAGDSPPIATEAHVSSALRSEPVSMWHARGRLAASVPRFDGHVPDMADPNEIRLASKCAIEELKRAHHLGIVLNDIQPSAVAIRGDEAMYIDLNLSLILPAVDMAAINAVLQRARGDWDVQKFLALFKKTELTGMFGTVGEFIQQVNSFTRDYYELMQRPRVSPSQIRFLLDRYLSQLTSSSVYSRAAGTNLKRLASELGAVPWPQLANPTTISRWIESAFSPKNIIKRTNKNEQLHADLASFTQLLSVLAENLRYAQNHVRRGVAQRADEYSELIAQVFQTDASMSQYQGKPMPYITWQPRNEDAARGFEKAVAGTGENATPRAKDEAYKYTNIAKLLEQIMEHLLEQFWISVAQDWETWYDQIAKYATPPRNDPNYNLCLSQFQEAIERLVERAKKHEFDRLTSLEQQLVKLATQLSG